MKILVTGNAGFIGFHVARALIERGDHVVGIDSINDYYDPTLKEARLARLEEAAGSSAGSYSFVLGNIADLSLVQTCFQENGFDRVIHLAAQAGVSYSMINPPAYVESNLVGFANILDCSRCFDVGHLTYASSSSVYGGNAKVPFSEHDGVNHPLQFYAATKRANELMAHSYSHLFRLPTTGIRFFTAYGPWGRPDMALFVFTKNILEGKPIKVYGHGRLTRDFTYIDDLVSRAIALSDRAAEPDPEWDKMMPDPASSNAPFRIINIGSHAPVKLVDYIAAIEAALGIRAKVELLPAQPEDLPDTFADVSDLVRVTGEKPATALEDGVERFVAWYRGYYGV